MKPATVPSYNLAYTLAFAVSGQTNADGSTIEAKDVRKAINDRIKGMSDDDMLVAIGTPFDAYVENAAPAENALRRADENL